MLLVLSLILILIFSTALVACGKSQDERQVEGDTNEPVVEDGKQLLIYTSMYPLYDFAKKIAGDKAEVINLVPAGAEPHDYEPTAKDIINLSQADLFVYNGGGFETWIEKIVEAVNSSTMMILDSTEHITLISNEESGQHHEDKHDDHNDQGHNGKEEDNHDDHEEDHGHGKEEDDHDDHGDDHDHEHSEFDPHVWLDPVSAKLQAEAIKNAIVSIDAANKEYYESNFTELAKQFDGLDAKYKELNQHIERRDFIVSHAAFGYIAYRYELNQVAISGLSPSNEPSAKQLKEVIEFVRENNIQYILFENLVTPKVAEVVRQEVAAEALVLHNLEGLTKEELSQGKDYFSIMEDNLDVLKKALGYK